MTESEQWNLTAHNAANAYADAMGYTEGHNQRFLVVSSFISGLAYIYPDKMEARRLAEKYRNLSCEDQDEADATILPWEK
jgi:hypothetical protein